jgi:hypothetical protein
MRGQSAAGQQDMQAVSGVPHKNNSNIEELTKKST